MRNYLLVLFFSLTLFTLFAQSDGLILAKAKGQNCEQCIKAMGEGATCRDTILTVRFTDCSEEKCSKRVRYIVCIPPPKKDLSPKGGYETPPQPDWQAIIDSLAKTLPREAGDTTIINLTCTSTTPCCDSSEWKLWHQFYPLIEFEKHGLSQQLYRKTPEFGLGFRINGRIDQIAPSFVPGKSNYFFAIEISIFGEREIDFSDCDTCSNWADQPGRDLVGKLSISAGKEWGYPFQKIRGFGEAKYDLLIKSEFFPAHSLWMRGGLRLIPLRYLEFSGFAQADGLSLLKGQQFLGGGVTLRVMVGQMTKPKGRNYQPYRFKQESPKKRKNK